MAKARRIAWLGWASMAALAMLVGCSGDAGPAGPAGPAGAPGRDGTGTPSVSAVSPGQVFLDRRVQVQISGNGTAWEAATPPAPDFGPGITVNGVQVASATSLIADITVGADAAVGARPISIDGATYTDAFTVDAPLETTILGTQAQGSILIALGEQRDPNTPFSTLQSSVFSISAGANSAGEVNEFDPYFFEALVFVDVMGDTGPTDIMAEHGIPGETVMSRAPAALEITARTPTEVTMGTPVTAMATEPLGTVLFSFTAPANVEVELSAAADNADAAPAFALLPASGKFADLIKYSDTVTIPAGTADELYYLVYWDQSGETGYEISITASEIIPTPPDSYEPNNAFGSATPVAAGDAISASIVPAGDNDWYAIDLPVNSTLTATVSAGETSVCGALGVAGIDSELEIYGTDGSTSLSFSEDINPGNYCSAASHSVLLDAGTYFVRVAASQEWCTACEFDYTVTFEVN